MKCQKWNWFGPNFLLPAGTSASTTLWDLVAVKYYAHSDFSLQDRKDSDPDELELRRAGTILPPVTQGYQGLPGSSSSEVLIIQVVKHITCYRHSTYFVQLPKDSITKQVGNYEKQIPQADELSTLSRSLSDCICYAVYKTMYYPAVRCLNLQDGIIACSTVYLSWQTAVKTLQIFQQAI